MKVVLICNDDSVRVTYNPKYYAAPRKLPIHPCDVVEMTEIILTGSNHENLEAHEKTNF